MPVEILIFEWCLELCSLVVSCFKASFLGQSHQTRVLTSVLQPESSVIQVEMVIDRCIVHLTRHKVLNLEPKQVLSAHNDVLKDILSLDLPCMRVTSRDSGQTLNECRVLSLNIRSFQNNVGDR